MDRRLDAGSRAPLAVGFSGGSDSRALLELATLWGRAHRRPVLALTVDHGLAPESARSTAQAGAAAEALGAQWRGLVWDGPRPMTGVPAAARAARHALLAEATRDAGARVLLLGHTADDRAESDWMRAGEAPGLGRLRSWAPSPVWPQGRGVFLLRPLLELARAELRAWLTRRGATWRDDPANGDPRFARARARAALAGAAPERETDASADAPAPNAALAGLGVLAWTRRDLCELAPANLRHLLSCAAVCAGGATTPPRSAQVARLIQAVRVVDRPPTRARGSGCAASWATLTGARVTVDAEQVMWTRDPGLRRGQLACDQALHAPGETIFDARWSVDAREAGWRIGFAAGRLGALQKAARVKLAALAPAARAALPLLADATNRWRAPPPFDDPPLPIHCLVGERFAAATGAVADEAALG